MTARSQLQALKPSFFLVLKFHICTLWFLFFFVNLSTDEFSNFAYVGLYVSFCFYYGMNEKDRNSCRETHLKQLEHKNEFGQPSTAYLHTQEKSTETANKFLRVEWCKVSFRFLERRFKVLTYDLWARRTGFSLRRSSFFLNIITVTNLNNRTTNKHTSSILFRSHYSGPPKLLRLFFPFISVSCAEDTENGDFRLFSGSWTWGTRPAWKGRFMTLVNILFEAEVK